MERALSHAPLLAPRPPVCRRLRIIFFLVLVTFEGALHVRSNLTLVRRGAAAPLRRRKLQNPMLALPAAALTVWIERDRLLGVCNGEHVANRRRAARARAHLHIEDAHGAHKKICGEAE